MGVREGASFRTVGFSYSDTDECVVSLTVPYFSMRIGNWHASNEDLKLLLMKLDAFSMWVIMYPKITAMSTNGLFDKSKASEILCVCNLINW